MNGIDFSELYTRAGFSVYEKDSRYWLKSDRLFIESIPTLEKIAITNSEILELLKYSNSICAIYISSESESSNSSEYIFSRKECNFDIFDSKTRNQIRKGLKSCCIKRPSIDDMRFAALNINKQVLKKQGRKSFLGCTERWNPYVEYLYSRKDVVISGSYYQDNLIGYIIFINVDKKKYIFHPFMDYRYSQMNPIMALLYNEMNNSLSLNNEITYSYGLKSYIDMSSLDHFKKNMLFDEVPVLRMAIPSSTISLLFSKPFQKIFSWLNKKQVISPSYYGAYTLITKCKNITKI